MRKRKYSMMKNYNKNGAIKMGFWGDRNYLNGKLDEILKLIHEDNEDIVIFKINKKAC